MATFGPCIYFATIVLLPMPVSTPSDLTCWFDLFQENQGFQGNKFILKIVL